MSDGRTVALEAFEFVHRQPDGRRVHEFHSAPSHAHGERVARTEIGGVTRDVTVTVTEGEQREALWQQILAAYPFFAGYQKKAARQIPVAVLQVVGEPVASPGDE